MVPVMKTSATLQKQNFLCAHWFANFLLDSGLALKFLRWKLWTVDSQQMLGLFFQYWPIVGHISEMKVPYNYQNMWNSNKHINRLMNILSLQKNFSVMVVQTGNLVLRLACNTSWLSYSGILAPWSSGWEVECVHKDITVASSVVWGEAGPIHCASFTHTTKSHRSDYHTELQVPATVVEVILVWPNSLERKGTRFRGRLLISVVQQQPNDFSGLKVIISRIANKSDNSDK